MLVVKKEVHRVRSYDEEAFYRRKIREPEENIKEKAEYGDKSTERK